MHRPVKMINMMIRIAVTPLLGKITAVMIEIVKDGSAREIR